MNFSDAIKSGFRNYVNFSGRAARSEYWYWSLFCGLIGIGSALIDLALFPNSSISPVNTIVELAVLLPTLAVSVRRLHDLDFNGWWLLLVLTGIGAFVLLGWFCLRGRRDRASDGGPNRFGPDPLSAAT
jgi:uncharacterized membrane protein YhaH (DUF805 family)